MNAASIRKQQIAGQLAILIAAVFWSTSGLFIKLLDWHPVVISGLRSFVAAIFILIFVFSVKMHERYLFPGLLFLVVYMIKNRNWKIAGLYVVFSVTFFIN